MSRTTQRELRALLRDARNVFGVHCNRKVWPKLAPFTEVVTNKLESGAAAVMITPYKNGIWMIYWVGSDCRENCRQISANDLSLSPEAFAQKYVAPCLEGAL